MSMKQHAFDAKQLCRTLHSGVLGTHSTSMPGYPFGSVVPYYLTPLGDAVIYISDIALHTRNIKADPKVSLTVYDALAEDSQANARVTLLGEAQMVADEQIKQQYLRLFPQAKNYEQTHDFNFYMIRTERIRYIGGFGKIYWIDKAQWMQEKQQWHQQPLSMISHMNDDHQDAMALILKARFGVSDTAPRMLSVFPEGAHYRCGGNTWYVPFDEVCCTAMDVRKALVRLTNDAREKLGIRQAS